MKRLVSLVMCVVFLVPIRARAAAPDTVMPVLFTPAASIYRFSDGLAAVCKDGKWGYTDENGRLVIPYSYSTAGQFHEGLAYIITGGKLGFIDKTGAVVIQPVYETGLAPEFKNGLAVVKKDGKWLAIDKTGKNISGDVYDNWRYRLTDGGFFAFKNGKWGRIGPDGGVALPFVYDNVDTISGAFNYSLEKDGKFGMADRNGIVVIEPQFDKKVTFTRPGNMTSYNSGVISQNGKVGLVGKNGKILVSPVWDDITYFSDGYAQVRKDGKWGYVDTTGKEVIACRFQECYNFCDGLAVFRVGDKYGIIDETGNVVVDANYDDIYDAQGGTCVIKNGNLWGLADKAGVLLEPYYENTMISNSKQFQEELIYAKKDGKAGFLGRDGKVAIPLRYDMCSMPERGLIIVQVDGLYGLIDNHGNTVVEPKLDYSPYISEERIAISVNDRDGYLDLSGNPVTEPILRFAGEYFDGYAKVMYNAKYGLIDKSGAPKMIFSAYSNLYDIPGINMEDMSDMKEGVYAVKVSGKWGYITTKGEIIAEPKYSTAGDFMNGLAQVTLNGKYGVVNKKGEEVLPPVFDKIANLDADFFTVTLDGIKYSVINKNRIFSSWAEQYKITELGTPQSSPRSNATREDFGDFLILLLSELRPTRNYTANIVFHDTDKFGRLSELGIVAGTGSRYYNPRGEISREEAAVILMKAGQLFGLTAPAASNAFSDEGQISSWAKEAVGYVSALGIMNGVGGNKFNPKAKYTREQSIVSIAKLYEMLDGLEVTR